MVSAKRLLDNHNGWSGLPLNGLLCNFHGDDDDDYDYRYSALALCGSVAYCAEHISSVRLYLLLVER